MWGVRAYGTAMIPTSMRAVVLDAPGPPEALTIQERPVPQPGPGQVLIKVHAFGINQSERHLRRGLATVATFPVVPGIEAVLTIAAAPSGDYRVGAQVATMMGGMGRTFDGGYAEYACVPATQVIPFHSDLDWATLGAVPEMLQTAYGSLTVGVNAQRDDTILVRGGSSSVGMAIAALARRLGLTIIATTRSEAKVEALGVNGASHVVLDDGEVYDVVRTLVPAGVHGAVELVGTGTLRDTMRAVRPYGTVCFTGMLSDEWTVPNFYPIDFIPRGVRLTAYAGEATDLPPDVLQSFLDDVAAKRATVPIARTYRFDDIVQAHRDLDAAAHSGKLVVVVAD